MHNSVKEEINLLSKTMTILLGIIQEKPVNAYELTKLLSKLNVKSWYNIADSTVYATIKSAEKKEYIVGCIEKSGNMPDKTVYSITEKGSQELLDTIESFICNFDYDITPFSIAVFFIRILGKDRSIILLEKRRDLLKKYEDGIKKQVENMKEQGVNEVFIGNTIQSLYIVEAQIKGVDTLIPKIKSM